MAKAGANPAQGQNISIWFFVGICLAGDGLLIFIAGLRELISPRSGPQVVLANLHANLWWGALMLALGLVYVVRHRPGKP